VDLPDPHPGPGQIRIVVHAVGISATDCKLRKGQLSFGAGLPQTTGRDVAGVVDEVGEGVTDVAVGDRVFGVSDDGAGAAELALLTHRAPIPLCLGFVDAAALPVALETATRSLDSLSVSRGISLLINGASGGVGSTAVQLAIARGARVIGTASSANHDYLRLLGAEPVTYGEGMSARVRALAPDGVDAALDVAGNGVLPELIDLAGGPRNVVTLADIDGAKQHEVRFSSGFQGHAFHALAEVGALIKAGRFWLPVERTYPLDEISEAHRVSEYGHVRGRLVLVIDRRPASDLVAAEAIQRQPAGYGQAHSIA
jgi:NADPH:quinone reductase-like Zn-dependent oxidoreductase